jgi:hypothetical protein
MVEMSQLNPKNQPHPTSEGNPLIEHEATVRLGLAGYDKFRICPTCGDIQMQDLQGGIYMLVHPDGWKTCEATAYLAFEVVDNAELAQRGVETLQHFLTEEGLG